MIVPQPIQLANLGMADSIILMVLALVVFGPRRLPQIGRQIGKLMYEFRKASNDFKFQMEEELRASEEADRRKKEEAERQRVAALAASSQASVSAPAQTVEAQADIGVVEPSAASPPPESIYPTQYPAETSVATPDASEPTIRPPQTGEQVSASRPDYFFAPPAAVAAESAAVAEVNPEAGAEANAAGIEAHAPANPEVNPGSGPAPDPGHDSQSAGAATNIDSASPPKEPVSQHG